MNRKQISFIFLLILTLLETFTCVYAWFVTNVPAEASGIGIRTSDAAVTDGNLSRYVAIYDESSNTYTYDEQNGNIDNWNSTTYPRSFEFLQKHNSSFFHLSHH